METSKSIQEPAPEERRIFTQLRNGDRHRLGELIDHYGEGLMRYLTALMGDSTAAEDAFQTTWVKVMEKVSQYDLDRAFAPWLFRVARNCAYDALRRRRRWWSRPVQDENLMIEEPSRDVPFVDKLAADDLTQKLLSGLKPKHRELIWLRFYQDLSYQEIADRCGIPLGTVKSSLCRALHTMTTLYRDLEGNES